MVEHSMATIRSTCRLCGSSQIDTVLELKPTALCDAYLTEVRAQERYPLNLCLCRGCGFVQIDCVVDPEEIYRDYIFVTTSSSPLSQHFCEYTKDVLKRTNTLPESTVVDIGSNDGTLLKAFKQKGCSVIGIEPAREIARSANSAGIKTIPEFFTPDIAAEITSSFGHVDLVTVNNLFANVDDLDGFVGSVYSILKDGGYLVVESSYLKDMIDNMVFDFIYHEHLSYFSVTPLVQFFDKWGMTLVDVIPVETKGGSLRYFIEKKKDSAKVTDQLRAMIESEKQSELDQARTYERFAQKIEESKNALKRALESYAKNATVGYGASATSTTLIETFELQDDLGLLVDDFDAKQGTYSPGTHIRVGSPEAIYGGDVEVVVILAWRYADQIMRNHKDFRGVFIIPLPELRVVSGNG